MNKTAILFALAVILGALTFWYLRRGDDKTTLAGADRQFAVKDAGDIHKIFLADRAGNQTTLERRDDHWLYNGQWRARPTAVNNLLEAVRYVEMKFKPSRAAVPNMVKSLASEGIKVEVYDRKNRLLKAYYVGGATADETGAYMILEGEEEPYVTYIPGWTGNIRHRYSLKGDDWRDRTVMAYDPDRIQSVSVEYPKQQNRSFILEKTGKTYAVKPFYDLTPLISRPYRERSAETYLIGFENLGAEAFENKNPERDSISALVPFAVVKVTDDKGAVQEARFHPVYIEGVRQDLKTGEYTTDPYVERYYVDIPSTGDFMLVQDRVFRKIFWAYDFFFEPQNR